MDILQANLVDLVSTLNRFLQCLKYTISPHSFPFPSIFEVNRYIANGQKLIHQSTENTPGSASLSAKYGLNSCALVSIGLLIDNQSRAPVSFQHLAGSID